MRAATLCAGVVATLRVCATSTPAGPSDWRWSDISSLWAEVACALLACTTRRPACLSIRSRHGRWCRRRAARFHPEGVVIVCRLSVVDLHEVVAQGRCLVLAGDNFQPAKGRAHVGDACGARRSRWTSRGLQLAVVEPEGRAHGSSGVSLGAEQMDRDGRRRLHAHVVVAIVVVIARRNLDDGTRRLAGGL